MKFKPRLSPMQWAVLGSLMIHLLALLPPFNINLDLKLPKQDKIEAVLLPPTGQAKKPVSRARSKAKPRPMLTSGAPTLAAPQVTAPQAPPVELEVRPDTATLLRVERKMPTHGRLVFEVSRGGTRFVLGHAIYDWVIEEGLYSIKSTAKPSGLVAMFSDAHYEQASSGRFDSTGFVPERFRDLRRGKENTAQFLWDEARLVLSDGREFLLTGGSQDLLSAFYQFGFFSLDEAEISLMVTNGRKYVNYTFAINQEPVALADGSEHPAYRLRYQGADGEDIEVWLAIDMARLPVRIRYTDRRGGISELLATEADYQKQP